MLAFETGLIMGRVIIAVILGEGGASKGETQDVCVCVWGALLGQNPVQCVGAKTFHAHTREEGQKGHHDNSNHCKPTLKQMRELLSNNTFSLFPLRFFFGLDSQPTQNTCVCVAVMLWVVML